SRLEASRPDRCKSSLPDPPCPADCALERDAWDPAGKRQPVDMSAGERKAEPRSSLTVVTDVPDYADALLGSLSPPRNNHGSADEGGADRPEPTASMLAREFFGGTARISAHPADVPYWRYIVVSGFSPSSQYERLIALARGRAPLPDGLACVARTGDGFRGFRGRSWIASPGNVHLTVHLTPERPIERFETVFMALAAVSVVEVVDSVPGMAGKAGIKWVNDVLVEGRKV